MKDILDDHLRDESPTPAWIKVLDWVAVSGFHALVWLAIIATFLYFFGAEMRVNITFID